jgi:hypothetical protein
LIENTASINKTTHDWKFVRAQIKKIKKERKRKELYVTEKNLPGKDYESDESQLYFYKKKWMKWIFDSH